MSTKNVSVAASIPADLAEFLDEKHWDMRMTRAELIAKLIADWAVSEGFGGETKATPARRGRKPKAATAE